MFKLFVSSHLIASVLNIYQNNLTDIQPYGYFIYVSAIECSLTVYGVYTINFHTLVLGWIRFSNNDTDSGLL